jgi:formamidopyrimidine-DNA glycosylase
VSDLLHIEIVQRRITSGMTGRSINDSVLNEHIESITFSELNNEDDGKVTNMDKRRSPDLCFHYVCYLTTLSHTKLNGVSCYDTRH